MPHGDFSDMASLVLLAAGVQLTAYTELSFAEVGPFKPSFNSVSRPHHPGRASRLREVELSGAMHCARLAASLYD